MSILIFGATGQLGLSLKDTQPSGMTAEFVDRSQCDLTDAAAIKRLLDQKNPRWIINAAAYTAVDRAEEESEQAHQINGRAVGAMASYVSQTGAKLIHISTDFIFNGEKSTPYQPGDPTDPLGEYGASKLAGEKAALIEAPESTMIIRTAWVYSEHGNNFVKTMLRLMSEKDELGVVDDQIGAPTYARGLAELIWLIINEDTFSPGIYHWTDQGGISWFEFAAAIQQEGLERGLLEREIPVKPITTQQYPTPAERPKYSVLDQSKLANRLGIEPSPWREQLKLMLTNMA